MDIYATFATDEAAEIEGAWFQLNATSRVRVARAGNDNYLATMRKGIEASGVDLTSMDKNSEAVAQGVLNDSMASAILLGWEGLSFKGEDLFYSVANARTLLGVKEFRKKVEGFSNTFEAYRVKAELAQGNG